MKSFKPEDLNSDGSLTPEAQVALEREAYEASVLANAKGDEPFPFPEQDNPSFDKRSGEPVDPNQRRGARWKQEGMDNESYWNRRLEELREEQSPDAALKKRHNPVQQHLDRAHEQRENDAALRRTVTDTWGDSIRSLRERASKERD